MGMLGCCGFLAFLTQVVCQWFIFTLMALPIHVPHVPSFPRCVVWCNVKDKRMQRLMRTAVPWAFELSCSGEIVGTQHGWTKYHGKQAKTSTPGNRPPKKSTDKVLRMSESGIFTVCFGPQIFQQISRFIHNPRHKPFGTLQPYKANSRITIQQDICKQNRKEGCFWLAFWLPTLHNVCFQAIRCSNETPMILLYIHTYRIWLPFCTCYWRSWVPSVLWQWDSEQDHQRDG